jgi:hypothetical protein
MSEPTLRETLKSSPELQAEENQMMAVLRARIERKHARAKAALEAEHTEFVARLRARIDRLEAEANGGFFRRLFHRDRRDDPSRRSVHHADENTDTADRS